MWWGEGGVGGKGGRGNKDEHVEGNTHGNKDHQKKNVILLTLRRLLLSLLLPKLRQLLLLRLLLVLQLLLLLLRSTFCVMRCTTDAGVRALADGDRCFRYGRWRKQRVEGRE